MQPQNINTAILTTWSKNQNISQSGTRRGAPQIIGQSERSGVAKQLVWLTAVIWLSHKWSPWAGVECASGIKHKKEFSFKSWVHYGPHAVSQALQQEKCAFTAREEQQRGLGVQVRVEQLPEST